MRAGGDSPELWRVEAACRDAWPAAQEVACGDWILRRSGGTTRRTNSANPIRWPAADIASTLERAHAFYTRHDQRLVFRVPSFLVEVVDELTGAGLTARAETTTLRLETALEDHPRDPAVEVTTSATERWREARESIAPSDPDQRRVFESMLTSIDAPARFASLEDEGVVAAVGYGVVSRGLLVLETVATHPDHRRKGLSQRLLSTILNRAAGAGTEGACLQVLSENAPARALYAGLGFTKRLYTYSYFQDPNED